MANNSASGGYLLPSTEPTYDTALEDLFQTVIVGITGLPGNLVRPRYQKDPPNQPGFDVDWASFGVYVEEDMWDAFRTLHPDGSYTIEGQELIRLKVAFYGPSFSVISRRWRDGMKIGQNRDALAAQKIAFVDFDPTAVVPALLKQQWVKKADVNARFHRWAVRTYPVLSLVSADVDIDNESYHTSVSVNPPSP